MCRLISQHPQRNAVVTAMESIMCSAATCKYDDELSLTIHQLQVRINACNFTTSCLPTFEEDQMEYISKCATLELRGYFLSNPIRVEAILRISYSNVH